MSRTGLYYGNCCRKACCESITTEKIDFFFLLYRTQDGQHHAFLQHLHRPGADKEYGLECVALSEEVLPRGAEGGLSVQRQGSQAATTSGGKQRQFQDLLVKVHGDVGSQLVWEVLQQLWR